MRWLVLLLAAHLLDVLTTNLGLAAGVPEANPLAAALMRGWGEPAAYGVKLALAVVVLGLLWWVRRRSLWPARVLCLAMVGVVVNNLVVIVGA